MSQSTLRPTNNKKHMIFQRKCSCCRESGHTITTCDDQRIKFMETQYNFMVETGSNTLFIEYMNLTELSVIRALCLRLHIVNNGKRIVNHKDGEKRIMYKVKLQNAE